VYAAYVVGFAASAFEIIADADFGYNANGDELYAAQQKHHAGYQQGAATNIVAHEFEHQQIQIDEDAQCQTAKAKTTKQVHGALYVLAEKHHGNEVAHNPGGTANAILAFAKAAGMVLYIYLCDFGALHGGQHGNEAVQLAVQTHFLSYLGPKYFEGAAVVFDVNTRPAADDGVGNFAG